MDKVVLTFIILALVKTARDVAPAIDGKAIVGLISAGFGALVGLANALLQHPMADWREGMGVGIALGVATYGGVAALDRHADRQVPDALNITQKICTRVGDHICEVNGPCNGLPRVNPAKTLEKISMFDPRSKDRPED